MATTYFGFAVSDSMFNGDVVVTRKVLTAEAVKDMASKGELTPCLNPSHQATINAMQVRYGIEVAIPKNAPIIALNSGDSVVVMSVRGLPRLDEKRHEYTEEEIEKATFVFSQWSVQ